MQVVQYTNIHVVDVVTCVLQNLYVCIVCIRLCTCMYMYVVKELWLCYVVCVIMSCYVRCMLHSSSCHAMCKKEVFLYQVESET